MMYSEFLNGTGASENEWTLKEYARINSLYMESETMEKEDAYKLYKEPDKFTAMLLEEIKEYKAEMIAARARIKGMEKTIEENRKEIASYKERLDIIERLAMSISREAKQGVEK